MVCDKFYAMNTNIRDTETAGRKAGSLVSRLTTQANRLVHRSDPSVQRGVGCAVSQPNAWPSASASACECVRACLVCAQTCKSADGCACPPFATAITPKRTPHPTHTHTGPRHATPRHTTPRLTGLDQATGYDRERAAVVMYRVATAQCAGGLRRTAFNALGLSHLGLDTLLVIQTHPLDVDTRASGSRHADSTAVFPKPSATRPRTLEQLTGYSTRCYQFKIT
ncbi:unnamed protein product [Taenia asiatica]|uniref:Transposase n=1 Tax=Taenia asiatica TaxID=60517 RepID=A0A0R3W3T3_TAEAS|nr:unnamed protein product [Taenia asiatica]